MNNKITINSTQQISESIEMYDVHEAEYSSNIQTVCLLESVLKNKIETIPYIPNYVDEVAPSQLRDVPELIEHIKGYYSHHNHRLVSNLWNNLHIKNHINGELIRKKVIPGLSKSLINAVEKANVEDVRRYLSYNMNLNIIKNIQYNPTGSEHTWEYYQNGNLLHAVVFQLMSSEWRSYLRSTAQYEEIFKLLIEHGIDISYKAHKKIAFVNQSSKTIEYDVSALSLIERNDDYIPFKTLIRLREAEIQLEEDPNKDVNSFLKHLKKLTTKHCRNTVLNYFSNLLENKKGLCLNFSDEQIELLTNAREIKYLTERKNSNNGCSMM